MKVFISYMDDCSFCLDELINNLKREGAEVTAKERSRISEKDIAGSKLVMVLAGDGTFLKTSHFVKDTPMIGINATPHRRIGFFCRASPSNVMAKFRQFKRGRLRPLKLMRLEGSIQEGAKVVKTFLALNEFYVGSAQPYHVSRYTLSVNGKSEYQKTSGLLIATPAGSSAWASTAGGRMLQLTAKKIQFVAREPVQSRIVRMKMVHGVLSGKARIKVVSDTSDGIIAVDSFPKTYSFRRGAAFTVKASDTPLNLLV